MKGLIIAGTNNLFTVECDDQITRSCTIKGKVLKSDKQFYNPLAPGDVVEIEIDPLNDEKGQILSLEPRKNTFLRWNVKGRCPQLLASNLDYLILVTTPDEPPFRPRFTDRALAQAEHQGITPIIAHVERYPYILSDPTKIYDWVMAGYLVQVNASTIISKDKMAKKLISWGLVQVVSTDAHNLDRRAPNLGKVKNADLLFNGDLIYKGLDVDVDPYCPRYSFGSWK